MTRVKLSTVQRNNFLKRFHVVIKIFKLLKVRVFINHNENRHLDRRVRLWPHINLSALFLVMTCLSIIHERT